MATCTQRPAFVGSVAALTDRRRALRGSGPFPVEIELNGAGMIAECTDFGPGGMRLLSAQPIPAGAALRLEFVLPGDSAPICTDAVVLRSEPAESEGARLAVKFVHITPPEGMHIASAASRSR